MTTDLKHALIKLKGCFSVLFSIFTCKQTSTGAFCKCDVELFCPVGVKYVGCGLCVYVFSVCQLLRLQLSQTHHVSSAVEQQTAFQCLP